MRVRPLTDLDVIRAFLETDRTWTAYALGDLDPGLRRWCEWVGAEDDHGLRALALLFKGFDPPTLLTIGDAQSIALILGLALRAPRVYLNVREEHMPAVRAHYRIESLEPMWRMALDPREFRPAPGRSVARLGPDDLPAVEALYADGAPVGQSPDFFSASMLEQGVFYGVWEAGALVSVAGTHLVSMQESVGAVGNVYTRRDRRGRGLATAVTSAVTAELVRLGLRTIALNVNQENAAAIRIYERLGYKKYCAFVEGLAARTFR